MSETTVQSSPATAKVSARPVSLITVVGVFVLFAAALLLVRYVYQPATVAPQSAAAENLPKDLEWRASAESRRAALAALKTEQSKKQAGYAWVDQKAGVIQLPIERAMELTVQKYGAKK